MQAEIACRKWIEDGPSVTLKFPIGDDPLQGIISETLPKVPAREFPWKLRDCKHEIETRQWIGLEFYPKKDVVTATWPCPREYSETFCIKNTRGEIDLGPANIERNFYY
jgi:hypothetical protein